jgi:hypothetical protein
MLLYFMTSLTFFAFLKSVFRIEPFNGSRTNGNVVSKKHRKKEKKGKKIITKRETKKRKNST